jgi:hypothetical protein
MTKGLCKAGAIANIKNMATGTVVAVMQSGDSVYGTLSTTGSDIISFDHYWQNDTTVVQLGVQCKASVGNLILSNVTEPTPPTPTPTPPPTGNPTITHVISVNSLGQIQIDGGMWG